MSRLEQTKREAARLWRLAKEDTNQNIHLNNLSHAREVVAGLKGYTNWHAYAESTRKQDFFSGKSDKKSQPILDPVYIHENFNQEFDLGLHAVEHTSTYDYKFKYHNRKDFPKITIIESNKINHHEYGLDKLLFKSKDLCLEQTPILYSGVTGAGRVEAVLQLCRQAQEQNHAVYYFDTKGWIGNFHRLVSYTKYKFPDTLPQYLDIRFNNEIDMRNPIQLETVDPLNPLVDANEVLSLIFGDTFANILNSAMKYLHNGHSLITIDTVRALYQLPRLIRIAKGLEFDTSTRIYASEYLESIGWRESIDELTDTDDYASVLYAHALNMESVYNTWVLLDTYRPTFSAEPTIDMRNSITSRRSLYIKSDSLEKSLNASKILAMLVAQFKWHMTNFNTSNPGVPTGVVVFDDLNYMENRYVKNICCNLRKETTWIFGIFEYAYNPENVDLILSASKTYAIMRSEEDTLPNKLRLKMLDTLEKECSILYSRQAKRRRMFNFKAGELYLLYPINAEATAYDIVYGLHVYKNPDKP